MATKQTKSKKTASKKKVTKKIVKQPHKKAENLAVMDTIKDKNVQMRPSWHFGLLGFALGLAVILLGFFTSLLMSAIVDEIRVASDNKLFELRGGGAFSDFPWALLILTILAVWLSYRLIRRLDLSHKHRGYLMFGSVGVALILGASFFSAIDASSSIRQSGPLERFSTFSRFEQEKVLRGSVIESNGVEVLVQARGRQYEVILLGNSQGSKLAVPGAEVVFVGQFDGEVFEAEIVKPAPSKRSVRGVIDERKREFEKN